MTFDNESHEYHEIKEVLNRTASIIHELNKNWWININTGEPLERNVGELLCLVHSEISEAMEGHRKGLLDDHLKDRPMIEVELADAMIRIFDIAAGIKVNDVNGERQMDIGGALVEKLVYNQNRQDHKIEQRLKANGKKY